MSIQAGWNSALYNLGLISALGDTKKKVGDVGDTVKEMAQKMLDQEREEQVEYEIQQQEAYEASERARQTDDYIAKRLAEQREDMALGIGGRMTPQEAARRASTAARDADAVPKNTIKGAMDALMKSKQKGYGNIMEGGEYNG